MNNNTRYWSFTWETNVKQKKLPTIEKLERFLNSFATEAIFQLERGGKKGKEHYQGVFTLNGPRAGKITVLQSFAEAFGGQQKIAGLTLSKVFSPEAIRDYVTKEEGRVSGPYYVGTQEKYNPEMATMKLFPWQEDLYSIVTSELQEELRDRKVILVENTEGGAGKSRFVKWMRTGQKKLVSRKLPVSSVDRLTAAIFRTSKDDVDVYTIDLPRTISKDLSLTDVFHTLEEVKNGHLIDTMYGKYNEAIFDAPVVIIFTNMKIQDLYSYMSPDRWVCFTIDYQKELVVAKVDMLGHLRTNASLRVQTVFE